MNFKSLFALTPAVALAAPVVGSQPDSKPNIVIIYTDDLGLGDVSFANGTVVETPNIDKQAAKGKIFSQYYSACPVSSPSRVALTTGMYHIRWNINTFLNNKKFNSNCEQSDFLDSSAPTLAKNLKTVGYKTAHIGKWHMGGGRDVKNAPQITSYGFDSYVSTWESPDPDPVITSSNWIWSATDSVRRWNRTAYFVDKCIDFLKNNSEKPCFLNLWPDDPHTPWVYDEATEQDRNSHESQKNLVGVIVELDKQLGRLFDYIEASGKAENTIIVFTSDNGPSPSFDQIRTNQKRGVKNSLYEGGINMPFFISWPAQIKAGQTDSKSVIASIDLMPTLTNIAGATNVTHHDIDGENISKAFLTNKVYSRKKDLRWEYGRNATFNYPQKVNRSLQLAIRHKNFKLYCNADGSVTELYDLKSDPNETTDISAKNKKLTDKLTKQLVKWYSDNDKEMLHKKQTSSL